MDENSTAKDDRRVDDRKSPDQYHSVKFTKSGLDIPYQSKLRDISEKGMCIVVPHDSVLLSHLNIGDILDMEYYTEEGRMPVEQAKTQIKHITKNDQGQFKEQYIVGLSKL
ncbi:MAG: hypothetical protein HN737_13910 [Desulfobacterales bacterium]|jgi:hypothetical protein|nr:hypothetical protein [Desulfobacteraceae bacterium]MBT7085020.1 hypothetical protein [Desulfobacterales bacterium]MBT7698490.1 hypothetical protein [Desulfobacterales bacterium]